MDKFRCGKIMMGVVTIFGAKTMMGVVTIFGATVFSLRTSESLSESLSTPVEGQLGSKAKRPHGESETAATNDTFKPLSDNLNNLSPPQILAEKKIINDLFDELKWNTTTDIGTIMATAQENLRTKGGREMSLLEIVTSLVKQRPNSSSFEAAGSSFAQVGSSSSHAGSSSSDAGSSSSDAGSSSSYAGSSSSDAGSSSSQVGSTSSHAGSGSSQVGNLAQVGRTRQLLSEALATIQRLRSSQAGVSSSQVGSTSSQVGIFSQVRNLAQNERSFFTPQMLATIQRPSDWRNTARLIADASSAGLVADGSSCPYSDDWNLPLRQGGDSGAWNLPPHPVGDLTFPESQKLLMEARSKKYIDPRYDPRHISADERKVELSLLKEELKNGSLNSGLNSIERRKMEKKYKEKMLSWSEDLAQKGYMGHLGSENPEAHLFGVLDYLVEESEGKKSQDQAFRFPSERSEWIKKKVLVSDSARNEGPGSYRENPSIISYNDPTDNETHLLAKESREDDPTDNETHLLAKESREDDNSDKYYHKKSEEISVEYLHLFESRKLFVNRNFNAPSNWVVIRRVFESSSESESSDSLNPEDSQKQKKPAKVSIHWPNYSDWWKQEGVLIDYFLAYLAELGARITPEERARAERDMREADFKLAKYHHKMRLV